MADKRKTPEEHRDDEDRKDREDWDANREHHKRVSGEGESAEEESLGNDTRQKVSGVIPPVRTPEQADIINHLSNEPPASVEPINKPRIVSGKMKRPDYTKPQASKSSESVPNEGNFEILPSVKKSPFKNEPIPKILLRKEFTSKDVNSLLKELGIENMEERKKREEGELREEIKSKEEAVFGMLEPEILNEIRSGACDSKEIFKLASPHLHQDVARALIEIGNEDLVANFAKKSLEPLSSAAFHLTNLAELAKLMNEKWGKSRLPFDMEVFIDDHLPSS